MLLMHICLRKLLIALLQSLLYHAALPLVHITLSLELVAFVHIVSVHAVHQMIVVCQQPLVSLTSILHIYLLVDSFKYNRVRACITITVLYGSLLWNCTLEQG